MVVQYNAGADLPCGVSMVAGGQPGWSGLERCGRHPDFERPISCGRPAGVLSEPLGRVDSRQYHFGHPPGEPLDTRPRSPRVLSLCGSVRRCADRVPLVAPEELARGEGVDANVKW